MAIRKTAAGNFMVDVSVKGHPRFYETVDTEDEAKILEKQKKEELKYGVAANPKAKSMWTLAEAMKATERECWSGAKAEVSSIRNAEKAIKFFGEHRPLDQIDTDLVDTYIEHLKGIGNSDSTINRKIAALSKMMTVAIQRGHLQSKPYLPRKKESQGRIRFVTPEEEAKILQLVRQWGQDDFYDVIVCLIDTGFRVGELRTLESRDVDFTTNLITIWDSKNTESRSVPMTQRVQNILSRRLSGIRCFELSKDWIRTPWDRLRGVLGLTEDKDFVPHCLRHTCASRLVQRGVGLKVVKEWMGHKSIQITLRYAHLAPSNLLDAVKVLEEPKLTVLRKAQ